MTTLMEPLAVAPVADRTLWVDTHNTGFFHSQLATQQTHHVHVRTPPLLSTAPASGQCNPILWLQFSLLLKLFPYPCVKVNFSQLNDSVQYTGYYSGCQNLVTALSVIWLGCNIPAAGYKSQYRLATRPSRCTWVWLCQTTEQSDLCVMVNGWGSSQKPEWSCLAYFNLTYILSLSWVYAKHCGRSCTDTFF